MDLLDLYHAHDHSLSIDESQVVNFSNAQQHEEPIEASQEGKTKQQRKARIVPWEPHKAAVTATRKGNQCPERLPELIAYAMEHRKRGGGAPTSNNETGEENVIKTEKAKEQERQIGWSSREVELQKEIKRLSDELGLEQNVNAELKRLMVATLSDELQGQVEALTTDKIRLAGRVDEYMGKLMIEDEEADLLRIDRDVWKCKFLAQSIRCDELTSKNEYLLRLLVSVQRAVRGGAAIPPEDISDFATLDLQSLFHRSPCDERVRATRPKFSNLTISCCPNCAGREIQLL